MRDLIRKNREFLLYALVGIGTIMADVGLYTLFVDRVGLFLANAIGWTGAVLFAFFTNKYIVFRTGGEGFKSLLREFLMFVSVRLVSLLLEVHGVPYLVHRGLNQPIRGITGGMAKLVITILVIIINYVFAKFLIFRIRRKQHDQ